MPLSFEFATAHRVLFGAGRLKDVPAFVRSLGSSVLVMTGSSPQRAAGLLQGLRETGLELRTQQICGEPRVEDVEEGAATLRRLQFPVVVGFGGGSVLDAAKAVSIMAKQEGTVLDFLEVVGRGRGLRDESLPCVAIPTTAGTGTEVTRNAVITSEEHRVKASLRSPAMLPRLALVDPTLCFGLPRSILAATGMDALTQLIEPFVSCRANPTVDALCREGMARSARSLTQAWDQPDDLEAREDLSLASLHSGWALANAGLGAVHGIAAPLGGMFKAPHGAVCAALLAPVMRMNWNALRTRAPGHPSIEKYRQVAVLLTGNAVAGAEEGMAWVEDLARRFEIPGLRHYGVRSDDFEGVAEAAQKASSMKANPIALETRELMEVLERVW